MIWTLLAFLCVLGTKFLTSFRLRGMRARLEAVQPRIDELKLKLTEAEEQLQALRLQVDERTELNNHLHDVVRQLEESLKQPVDDTDSIERVQLMETVERESAEA
jgi:hypothetical protein